ncbi:MAG: glycosyltransferase family 4 protein [Methylophilaceae bacterium]|nr:glycosyltransferase family 4 protein [Methylophilaceae bacterium]
MVDLIFSFSVTLFCLFVLLKTKLRFLAIDQPNERSLHTTITPRTGGLAIMAGILLTWLFIGVTYEWIILPLVLVAVSLIDDIRGLKARWRFLAQFLVCMAFLALHPHDIAVWMMPIVLLAMVWMVNLYNFMDGSDGLAGGMAVIGFGAYAGAAYLGGYPDMFVVCATISGACLAFLIFNFHPAKIFMGDSGSIPLGFLAAALGIWGWQQTLWPVWFPILVFSPFIMDATMTLMKRLLRGEKVWLAHKSHYYQRLVQMGWGHRKTAITHYILMLFASISAIVMMQYWADWVFLMLGLWLFIYIILMVLIDIAWSRHEKPKHS